MRLLKFFFPALILMSASLGVGAYETKEYVKGFISTTDKGAARDSMWALGHAYRQWIYDQNYLADDNSNLDPEVVFLDDGKLRSHAERVYFYDDVTTAIERAKASRRGLAFYLFDHTCAECLFILPQLYTRPEVVEASKDFVNCYVELPRLHNDAYNHGMMTSSLTVQFFLPGMRRVRVVDNPDEAKLIQSYREILSYIDKLDPEALLAEPKKSVVPSRSGY